MSSLKEELDGLTEYCNKIKKEIDECDDYDLETMIGDQILQECALVEWSDYLVLQIKKASELNAIERELAIEEWENERSRLCVARLKLNIRRDYLGLYRLDPEKYAIRYSNSSL